MKFTTPSDRGYILGDMPERLIQKLTTGQGICFMIIIGLSQWILTITIKTYPASGKSLLKLLHLTIKDL